MNGTTIALPRPNSVSIVLPPRPDDPHVDVGIIGTLMGRHQRYLFTLVEQEGGREICNVAGSIERNGTGFTLRIGRHDAKNFPCLHVDAQGYLVREKDCTVEHIESSNYLLGQVVPVISSLARPVSPGLLPGLRRTINERVF